MIKIYNAVINRKTFYTQPIDSDVKQYETIRKLTTWQSEDYILLDVSRIMSI